MHTYTTSNCALIKHLPASRRGQHQEPTAENNKHEPHSQQQTQLRSSGGRGVAVTPYCLDTAEIRLICSYITSITMLRCWSKRRLLPLGLRADCSVHRELTRARWFPLTQRRQRQQQRPNRGRQSALVWELNMLLRHSGQVAGTGLGAKLQGPCSDPILAVSSCDLRVWTQ